MTRGALMRRTTEALAGPGVIWLVDAAGNTHILGVEAYCALTAAQLEGSHVFTTAESAERFASGARPARN